MRKIAVVSVCTSKSSSDLSAVSNTGEVETSNWSLASTSVVYYEIRCSIIKSRVASPEEGRPAEVSDSLLHSAVFKRYSELEKWYHKLQGKYGPFGDNLHFPPKGYGMSKSAHSAFVKRRWRELDGFLGQLFAQHTTLWDQPEVIEFLALTASKVMPPKLQKMLMLGSYSQESSDEEEEGEGEQDEEAAAYALVAAGEVSFEDEEQETDVLEVTNGALADSGARGDQSGAAVTERHTWTSAMAEELGAPETLGLSRSTSDRSCSATGPSAEANAASAAEPARPRLHGRDRKATPPPGSPESPKLDLGDDDARGDGGREQDTSETPDSPPLLRRRRDQGQKRQRVRRQASIYMETVLHAEDRTPGEWEEEEGLVQQASKVIPPLLSLFSFGQFEQLYRSDPSIDVSGILGTLVIELQHVCLFTPADGPTVVYKTTAKVRVDQPRRTPGEASSWTNPESTVQECQSTRREDVGTNGVKHTFFSNKSNFTKMVFPISSSHARVVIDVHAGRKKVMGTVDLSLHALRDLQTSETMLNSAQITTVQDWDEKQTVARVIQGYHSGPEQEPPVEGFNWHELTLPAEQEKEESIGKICFRARYYERLGALTQYTRLNDEEPQPEFDDLASSSRHIKKSYDRVTKIVAQFLIFRDMYDGIWNWESPERSITAGVAILYLCLLADPQYFMAYVALVPVVLMTKSLWKRLCGQYVDRQINSAGSSRSHRAIANLRLAVGKAKGLPMVNPARSQPFVGVHIFFVKELHENAKHHKIGKCKASKRSSDPEFQLNRHNHSSVMSSVKERAKTYFRNSDRQDVLQDVMEKWTLHDNDLLHVTQPGVPDNHGMNFLHNMSSKAMSIFGDDHALLAFKYPMLQPVSAGLKKKILPFSESRGYIILDVYHEGKTGQRYLARAQLPVNTLISNEDAGGDQDPQCIILKLFDPRPPSGGASLSSDADLGFIQVFAQLTLPGKNATWTELDASNQQTLETLLEGADSKNQTSIYENYKRARRMITMMQLRLASVADFYERTKNLLNWTHPTKTAVVYFMLIAFFLACWTVPFRYLFLAWSANKLGKGWKRKYKKRRNQSARHVQGIVPQHLDEPAVGSTRKNITPLLNLIQSMPSDCNLEEVYSTRSEKLLEFRSNLAKSHNSSVQLQAKWSGYIHLKRMIAGWRKRFLVIRQGVALIFHSEEDALEGQPPRKLLFLEKPDDAGAEAGEGEGGGRPTSRKRTASVEVLDEESLQGLFGDTAGLPEKHRAFAIYGKPSGGALERLVVACPENQFSGCTQAIMTHVDQSATDGAVATATEREELEEKQAAPWKKSSKWLSDSGVRFRSSKTEST